ncbi:hypothetical protein CANCADRAFT_458 [Tortispora caseinolytica NRRL Y-17796]|uniref:Regulator of phospholipase D SRF1 n=1 Tax=Tortispora caseinolytica NRRL Y-17796 TaxID=767744 RepID=A0A1E4TJE6_9ASCO|nr:hypothetical protein CANCADRAFT_458 [Tortispora caseinolytica NRRL Y-17796]
MVSIDVTDSERQRANQERFLLDGERYFQANVIPVNVLQSQSDYSYPMNDDVLSPLSGQRLAKSRWHEYLQRSRPQIPPSMIHPVSKAELDHQQPDLDKEWIGLDNSVFGYENSDAGKKKKWYIFTFFSRTQILHIMLNNPFIPLTLRTIIFIFSITCLGLAVSIFRRSDAITPQVYQLPSTIMSIVVQSIAVLYLVYITYDEYTSKPLGLREAKAKMRLIMLDLLFIIFIAASLSLAMENMLDIDWVCSSTLEIPGIAASYDYAICQRQRGLSAMLCVVLILWVLTFTVSVFRLVERVSR